MKSFLNYSKNRILYNIFRFLIIFLLVFLVSKCNVSASETLVNFSSSIQNIGYGMANATNVTWDGTTIQSGGLDLGLSNYVYIPSAEINSNSWVFYGIHNIQLIMRGGTIKEGHTYKLVYGISTTNLDISFDPSDVLKFYNVNCGIETSNWNFNYTCCTDQTISFINDGTGRYTLTTTFTALVDGTGLDFAFGVSNPPSQNSFISVFMNNTTTPAGITIREAYLFDLGASDSSVDLGPIINQNQTIIDQNNQTNDKLDDIQGSITDETPPDTSSLSDSAGWLPAGPVDSILNLPLTMFQNISNNLGSTCTPINLPLPFVNKSLELPCFNSIVNSIEGMAVWWNGIGVVASAFILYSYLMKLYKWVDDTLTMRENTWQDWGGV